MIGRYAADESVPWTLSPNWICFCWFYETVNGVQTQYTYDDSDRLIQTGGTVYTYDNNGNTLTETLDGQTKSYTYNAKNELVNIQHGRAASLNGAILTGKAQIRRLQ